MFYLSHPPISSDITSYHLTSLHPISLHLTSSHITSSHITLSHIVSRHLISLYLISSQWLLILHSLRKHRLQREEFESTLKNALSDRDAQHKAAMQVIFKLITLLLVLSCSCCTPHILCFFSVLWLYIIRASLHVALLKNAHMCDMINGIMHPCCDSRNLPCSLSSNSFLTIFLDKPREAEGWE